MTQTPRRHGPGRDQRESQPRAKGQHHGDSEGKSFQLKADQDDGESRRTRQQTSRESKKGDLIVGGGSACKSLPDVRGMGEFVRVLKVGEASGLGMIVLMPVVMVVVVIVAMTGFGFDIAMSSPSHPERQSENDEG